MPHVKGREETIPREVINKLREMNHLPDDYPMN